MDIKIPRKLYEAIEHVVENENAKISNSQEENEKKVEELKEIMNDKCPAMKEIYVINGKLDANKLKEAFFKTDRGQYAKINHNPNNLIETLAEVFNMGGYNSNRQLVTACGIRYNRMNTNGKNVENDFDFMLGFYDIKIEKK